MPRLLLRSLLPALLAGLMLLGGCATTKPLPRFVWPAPPDEPRLEWVGVYYSEESFEKTPNQKLIAKMIGERGDYTFKAPFGVTTDGHGIVYVSDTFDRNVRVYDFNQKTVEFLTEVPVFQKPLGLDIDSAGNLYIVDGDSRKVYVFNAQHQPVRTYESEEQFDNPAYVAVNEELQRVYVSDGRKHHIVVFALDGEYLFTIGKRGNGDGEFFSPQGLEFGPDGNLYVCDMFNARIQILTKDGEFVGKFGERGDQPSQFENPKDLAFDSDGHLYVIDGRRSDLSVFTADGTILLAVGDSRPTTSQFGFSTPKGIYVDANDRIYVAESLGRRFAVWQYMSQSYLARHPYTEQDEQALRAYMEEFSKKQK